ncbi:ankyrin repeat domain-containing protein [Acidovorax carolinensis]|uniref:ankyrin repeat domain-containing protein n=1 Tax=Acidovorax carolinensis TaxID=553814 RepID=UPI000B342C94|nr:ankyrin repeat domain-containing protein [Acidovorax carolinensis]ART49751.1 hypothetical protein CBP33_17865 [Acidovorax carolinensis]
MHKQMVVAAAMAAALGAQAKDIRDQWDIQISKAELVFPGGQPQDVANGVKEAISQFAIPANLSYRPLPSPAPARPGSPTLKQVATSVPSPEYFCEGAYAEITKRPPPVQNVFAFLIEGHQLCLYSFDKGVKAYVIYYNVKKLESLTSGLFNGITRAIRGKDEDRAAGQLKENIASIRAKLPGLLVERIEVPGLPVETPDAQAVAALIPPPSAAPALAMAPATTAAPIVAPNGVQAKVEARKNLTAMGMTYHSQAQFLDAIRRKDDVAVQLFLDGGGIDALVADSTGQTPLQLAQAKGNADIVALLQPRPAAVAAAAATPAPVATPAAAATVPPLLRPIPAGSPAVDYNQLPAEIRAEMDDAIAGMNLTPEQQALARNNLALQFMRVNAQVKALNR